MLQYPVLGVCLAYRTTCGHAKSTLTEVVDAYVIISALEVFLNDMRYINPRFTYLLTYLPASPHWLADCTQPTIRKLAIFNLL